MTLSLVPTPIGNMEDITLRALKVLGDSDFILCEDTRQTIKLLNHYEIKKKLVSFFSYNQEDRIPWVIGELKKGKNLALVSDRGTPGISDPGFLLVSRCLKESISVVALPGPTALITALVISGLPTDGFVYLGFLKKKAGKIRKELLEASVIDKTIIFYESPFRIKKTMAILSEIFSENAEVAIARELTKSFEEVIRGTVGQVREQLEKREIKGELVVLVHPQKKEQKAEV